jgi:hypothetical protein
MRKIARGINVFLMLMMFGAFVRLLFSGATPTTEQCIRMAVSLSLGIVYALNFIVLRPTPHPWARQTRLGNLIVTLGIAVFLGWSAITHGLDNIFAALFMAAFALTWASLMNTERGGLFVLVPCALWLAVVWFVGTLTTPGGEQIRNATAAEFNPLTLLIIASAILGGSSWVGKKLQRSPVPQDKTPPTAE